MIPQTVLITGAAGNLGAKLRHHLEGRYDLRLLDRDPGNDPVIRAVDLSRWDETWAVLFAGVDAVEVGTLALDDRAVAFWSAVGFGPWRVTLRRDRR